MSASRKTMAGVLCTGLCLLPFFGKMASAAQEEVTGDYVIKPNDCGQPNFKGERSTHLLMDRVTGKGVVLDVTGLDMSGIKTGSRLMVRGDMQSQSAGAPDSHGRRRVIRPTSIVVASNLTSATGNVPTVGEASPARSDAANLPPKAGTVTVTDFKCLLLFANTSDYTVNQTKKTTSETFLFGSGGNVSDAFYDSTYGYYRLIAGDSVILDLTNETATANNSDQMWALMNNKAKAIGYDTVTGTAKPYQRVFFFLPNGVTGISTAWAYIDSIGGAWGHSVYCYNWTGAFFDGHAHENSHNCGFQHSSEGGTEYGDETCVMGYSHSGSSKTAISTLNPVKKAQLGVFDGYPGTKLDLSTDATLDMYPLALSPTNQAGVRCVTLSGTDYYISYRRSLTPYGKIWNSDSAKIDKVVVYSNTDFGSFSYLSGYANEGGTYSAGGTIIHFERYGDTGKNYATVSFDLADGNAKPVAIAQSPTVYVNTPQAITLGASDGDGDSLAYTVVADPVNGVLSGTGSNLTYTPNTNYIGADSFVFRVDDGLISDFETVSISVTAPEVSVTATDASASEEGPDSGVWTITRTGNTDSSLDVVFTVSGSATLTDDYTLTASSPLTIATGQSATNITLTPVNDSTPGEGTETAIFTISADAGYVIGTASGTISIADNDYVAPAVSNYGFTAISETSASVSGWVSSGGVVNAWICWGSSDGGMLSTDNWAHAVDVGSVPQGTGFSTNINGLVVNGTYWYRCYATNGSGEGWSPTASSFHGTLRQTLPFSEDFEARTPGDLDGQNLWSASNAVVQSSLKQGSQAGSITSETGFVRQDFTGTNTDVWTDMNVQPVFCPTDMSPLSTAATASVYFNTNGNPVAFDGTNRVTYTGTVVTTGRWIRVTIHSDYVSKTWDLYIDSLLIGSALGFYNNAATGYEKLDVRGGAPDVMAIDNIGVSTTSPLSTEFWLTVNSPFGSPSPSGTVSYAPNALIAAYMPGSPIELGGATQYVCTGWARTGSEPGTGLGTNTSFTITEDTALTWQWKTNYLIAFNVSGQGNSTGTIDHTSGWYPSSTNLAVTATPHMYSVFSYWTGDTNNAAIVTNQLSFDVDASRLIVAVFSRRLTATNAVPYEWIAQFPQLTNNFEMVVTNDADGDGLTTAQEYWSGTNPDDADSYLHISGVGLTGGNVQLIWKHAQVDSSIPPILIEKRTNLLAGNWSFATNIPPVNGTNTWTDPVSGQRYYRLAAPVVP